MKKSCNFKVKLSIMKKFDYWLFDDNGVSQLENVVILFPIGYKFSCEYGTYKVVEYREVGGFVVGCERISCNVDETLLYIVNGQKWTKELIQYKLSNDDKWVEKSILMLFENQTNDEQKVGFTKVYNDIGFNGVDGRYLSYCAKWIIRGNHLNEKHMNKCKHKLPKYWKQIQNIIKQKEVRV